MGVTKEKKERGKKTKNGKKLGFYKNPKTPRKEEQENIHLSRESVNTTHLIRERDLYEEELGGKTSGTTVVVTTASL